MVELRQIVVLDGATPSKPVLQWRCRKQDPWGMWTLWGDWEDVPTVVLAASPNTASAE